ncbi:hypothetical protein BN1723_014546 [Verticillium longisporum]|uniref:Uncharacterized protein n=1 Tax=Verticillium longisporum TaxID=100787 RepID=A0A0G4MBQ5_VERLO|nr:hypothetical protein BN1723_014546 [Verticillium longisporum]
MQATSPSPSPGSCPSASHTSGGSGSDRSLENAETANSGDLIRTEGAGGTLPTNARCSTSYRKSRSPGEVTSCLTGTRSTT